jgi:hypothetical protein
MKRIALAATVLSLFAMSAPIAGAAAPTDTNPIGSLRYLPSGTNEQPAAGATRLVVVFSDGSIEAGTGAAVALAANGPFGVRFSGVVVTATGPAVPTMVGHSQPMDDVKSASSNMAPDAINGAIAGVAGDTRDGACSKVGTPSFLYAYSKTRTETTTQPYAPVPCERIDSAIPIMSGTSITGWTTTITKFTPGFWIDLTGVPTATWTNAVLHYGAVYDTEGQSGEFYTTSDEAGSASLVGGPTG